MGARLTTSSLAILASLAVPLVPAGTQALAEPLLDGSGLAARSGTLAFATRGGGRLEAATYRATGFDPDRGPIWFVIHGAGRTAESYRDAAAPVAERHGALAIAPLFPESEYPGSDSWTLAPDVWSEVERAFEQVREALGGAQDGYYLFGHSAGAQFVHRLLTFLPDAQVLGAVAANAGWYTMPGADRDFPYGLRGTPLGDDDLRPLVRAHLAVLAGERDVATPDEDALLRGTPEAMAQGGNRLARARTY
ncbi:MAG: alpha/beta fold hydrolase, partial [bacterium]